MDAVALAVGIGWTFAGMVIIAASIPLTRGWVPRNSLYGVRLPSSLESDEAWFTINRFGGKRLAQWAVVLVLIGLCCFFLPLQKHPTIAIIVGFAPIAVLAIPIVQTALYAKTYKHNR